MAEIDKEILKPNSNKAKEEAKKEKPSLIQEDSLVRKRNNYKGGLMSALIKKDMSEVLRWLFYEKVIPGGKELFLMALGNWLGVDMYDIFDFGGSDRRRGQIGSYQRAYDRINGRNRDRRREPEDRGKRNSDKLDYHDIVLRYRPDAERVVDAMQDRIEQLGQVSVAELFEMIHEPSDYTDTAYGWTRTSDVDIRKVRDGWLIDVAEAKYLG